MPAKPTTDKSTSPDSNLDWDQLMKGDTNLDWDQLMKGDTNSDWDQIMKDISEDMCPIPVCYPCMSTLYLLL